MLVLSQLKQRQNRVVEATSVASQRCVAALADAILIAHAEPRGAMEHLSREVVAWGIPLDTMTDDVNRHLILSVAEAERLTERQ